MVRISDSLTKVLAGNKAKCLLSVNHSTKTIHHHHHHHHYGQCTCVSVKERRIKHSFGCRSCLVVMVITTVF